MQSPVRLVCAALAAAGLAAGAPDSAAFCGFYVARADARLFNQASQVVIARDGDRTVMTLSNDYRGEPTEFALVVPVPTFLERGQIRVGDRAAIEHLDAWTAPRLVEYFTGETRCAAGGDYRRSLRERREREARTLAALTGRDVDELRRRLGLDGGSAPDPRPWWRELWPD